MESDVDAWFRMEGNLLANARKRVKAEAVARKGPAHQVIIHEAQARHASFIVVGSHGRTGLKRMVLGSVADAVVHHSHVPVLVVPA